MYVVRKFRPKDFEKKKGMKKNRDAGTPTSILLAKRMVFSRSLCSLQEKKRDIILSKGRAIMNPAKFGFLQDSQLANTIIKLEKITFVRKNNILRYDFWISQKSFLSLILDFEVVRKLYQ